jgi:hypothetical protein
MFGWERGIWLYDSMTVEHFASNTSHLSAAYLPKNLFFLYQVVTGNLGFLEHPIHNFPYDSHVQQMKLFSNAVLK